MSAKRVIARLDIKGPNLVKGIHLEGLRVLGNPEDFAKHYYLSGADEIFYMDVVASLFERNSLKDIISQTAKNIFIPITVGGGIRSVHDMREVLKAGADKICFNTAAIRNPKLITEASLQFGSSTVVVAIEVIKQGNGEYLAFIDNGREHTGVEALSWAKTVESLGAGEIVLTSVDKEGTGEGFDQELIQLISQEVNIPIVAHGGAGVPLDVCRAIDSGASAVAVSSILHYGHLHDSKNGNTVSLEGNRTFLNSGKSFSKIQPSTIAEIKSSMKKNGIECREIFQ